MKKAILDIGTNSIKAFVCEDGKIVSKDAKYECRIGKGFVDEIPPENVKAAVEVLKEISLEHDMPIEAFGTEIFRIAKNSKKVIEHIDIETGIKIKVLSHDEELEVYWKGITKTVDHDGMIAAIDIGGGTVQFMYGDRYGLKGKHKLNTGVLFLRERFTKGDPITEEEFEQMEEYIQEQIKEINVTFPEGTPYIHGSSSVIDFYTEAGLRMTKFSDNPHHPYKVSMEDCEAFYRKTRCLPAKERHRYFPSHPGFTDGAAIGLASLLLIAKKTGLTFEVPSNNNIIYGFL